METVKQQLEDQPSASHQMRIGGRIAELRKEKGLSQAKLAKLAGVHSSYIGKVELGKFDVGVGMLSKIGGALGVELDFVVR